MPIGGLILSLDPDFVSLPLFFCPYRLESRKYETRTTSENGSGLGCSYYTSLVPRPLFAGEEKTAWYTVGACALFLGIRARLHITATFERNLPLYSRILRHVGRRLGMVNKLSMVR